MTTAIGETPVIPWRLRYSIALSLQTEAQQARTASKSADSPRTPRSVSCCPARLWLSLSSSTPDERTATAGFPNRSYAAASAASRPDGKGNGSLPHGPLSRSRICEIAAVKASTVTQKPSGTGRPSPRHRARDDPFPPTRKRFWALTSSSQRITACLLTRKLLTQRNRNHYDQVTRFGQTVIPGLGHAHRAGPGSRSCCPAGASTTESSASHSQATHPCPCLRCPGTELPQK